ncbi:MAG TPA: PEP-CTERM sorting domain-containing protein [Gemmatimonadales bacterium]|nr:PEP-CTERM sorting domain-containing protein [Gemmatimonadales bacterium]
MDAERTPRPEEVERYHAHAAGCPHCAHWATMDAERQGLERMLAPRRPWWRRLWRALLFCCAVCAGPTAAEAIPACWSIAPVPFGVGAPYGIGISPQTCGGPDRFVLSGADYWGQVYLELPAASLGVQRDVPDTVDAAMIHYWLRVLTAHEGDVRMVDPDEVTTRWLFGSGVWPDLARADDEPLTHSPEPATVALVLTTAGLIGWRKWRQR